MKKIIAILAVAFAVSVSAQVNNSAIDENVAVATQAEEFEEVKLETLATEVQTAIKAEVEKAGCTIKTISQEKTSKDLKVVAVNAQNVENVFMFDQAGKLKK
jgi:hypothetical protein